MFTAPVTSIDHIRATGITRQFGDRVVLDGVDLVVGRSERLGLIGENGAGKSTLLRILAGVETADAGTVARPARTGLLWQEVRFDASATLGELIEESLAGVRAIEQELEDAANGIGDVARERRDGGERDSEQRYGEEISGEERYAAALAAAETAEVWSVESRRDATLAGLGVADIPIDRTLGSVSGGQRSRFALAALLLARPEALLLDEPTNHLDDAAIDFLRSQLLGWRGPVLFASHDRAFLDEVATGLVDIDPSRGGPVRFSGQGGAYTAYLEAKSAERARWEAQFAEEQNELNRLRHAVDVTTRTVAPGRAATDNDKFLASFKAGRQQVAITRRVRNAEGRLHTLEREQVRKPSAVLAFAGIPTGSHTLAASEVLVQWAGGRARGGVDLPAVRIAATSQLLVTGANGAGKSTLLGVLAGGIEPEEGSVSRRKGLRIGLLEQDIRWSDATVTPRAMYETRVGEKRAESVPLSALGLISPRDLDRPIGALSIGQQRRLALALIIARPPHLFLLDEPTNHLSLSLATDLEDALGSYPGAVVVASHDRWLRRRWTRDILPL